INVCYYSIITMVQIGLFAHIDWVAVQCEIVVGNAVDEGLFKDEFAVIAIARIAVIIVIWTVRLLGRILSCFGIAGCSCNREGRFTNCKQYFDFPAHHTHLPLFKRLFMTSYSIVIVILHHWTNENN